ncbi:MAG: PKD domain-containing protein [Euryarchaeota archaeon]|nr:PKD domain-containing protein [Euryarchaeota archaeon]MDE1836066.1 PKD domain-containing protein [Euryarchaeota archaeon]MDE1879986.1 PKD domain-containing protein [Euryarchaeota archaeon]MDE2044044.1 PKD domain-containing protein [Thermoplasmata archaeon]
MQGPPHGRGSTGDPPGRANEAGPSSDHGVVLPGPEVVTLTGPQQVSTWGATDTYVAVLSGPLVPSNYTWDIDEQAAGGVVEHTTVPTVDVTWTAAMCYSGVVNTIFAVSVTVSFQSTPLIPNPRGGYDSMTAELVVYPPTSPPTGCYSSPPPYLLYSLSSWGDRPQVFLHPTSYANTTSHVWLNTTAGATGASVTVCDLPVTTCSPSYTNMTGNFDFLAQFYPSSGCCGFGPGWTGITVVMDYVPFQSVGKFMVQFFNLADGLQASATASPLQGVLPLPVSFGSSARGGLPPYTFNWTFGDGTSVYFTQNPNHTFTSTGTFHAWLNVTDSLGFSVSVALPAIAVVSPLSAVIVPSSVAGPPPFTVSLAASLSGGLPPFQYSWDLGNGATASGPSTAATYVQPGAYLVSLTVSDALSELATTYAILRADGAPTFPVTFQESGLPSGVQWGVAVDGDLPLSTGPSLTVDLPNATYVYGAVAAARYLAQPATGIFTVQGSPVSVHVSFVASPAPSFLLDFLSSDLPRGVNWTVHLAHGGVPLASGGCACASVPFVVPNGAYGFTVGGASGFKSNRTVGNATIQGAADFVLIGWDRLYPVAFNETGLPASTNWSVQLGGDRWSTTTNSVTFEAVNGTYNFTVLGPQGYRASPGSGSLSVHGPALVSITFSSSSSTWAGLAGFFARNPWLVVGAGASTIAVALGIWRWKKPPSRRRTAATKGEPSSEPSGGSGPSDPNSSTHGGTSVS